MQRQQYTPEHVSIMEQQITGIWLFILFQWSEDSEV